jgi:nitrogen fixation protein FixH
MNPAAKWILAIVSLLAANVIGTTVLIVEAHSGASRVIPSYYDRAVHYDDAIDQAARNRALGWSVTSDVNGGVVTVAVHDGRGAALAGANVHVEAVERSASARAVSADLAVAEPGTYRGHLAGMGWLDVAISVTRGADRFVQRIAIEAR